MKRPSIALWISTLFAIPTSLLVQASSKPIGNRVAQESASTLAATMPTFSWDTLPLYIHVRKAKKFTPEELKYLASFNPNTPTGIARTQTEVDPPGFYFFEKK